MNTEIIFKNKDYDIENNKQDYTKVFLNVRKDKNITKLSLSKYKGDILYIISNKDFEDVYDYFKVPDIKMNKTKIQLDDQVKKSKQGNLFSFIKKK